jgi:hypothetical protein
MHSVACNGASLHGWSSEEICTAADGAVRWMLHSNGLASDFEGSDEAFRAARDVLGTVLLAALDADCEWRRRSALFLLQNQGGVV